MARPLSAEDVLTEAEIRALLRLSPRMVRPVLAKCRQRVFGSHVFYRWGDVIEAAGGDQQSSRPIGTVSQTHQRAD